eukprot:gb/GECG01001827.1/.p1 GENE.gb/GECG01001827.1/~~gb/GECG01001827.1/.p1  ORF type:complete len:479 (+),score=90.88 gb/GECG01001827.1/:1-1437(+)
MVRSRRATRRQQEESTRVEAEGPSKSDSPSGSRKRRRDISSKTDETEFKGAAKKSGRKEEEAVVLSAAGETVSNTAVTASNSTATESKSLSPESEGVSKSQTSTSETAETANNNDSSVAATTASESVGPPTNTPITSTTGTGAPVLTFGKGLNTNFGSGFTAPSLPTTVPQHSVWASALTGGHKGFFTMKTTSTGSSMSATGSGAPPGNTPSTTTTSPERKQDCSSSAGIDSSIGTSTMTTSPISASVATETSIPAQASERSRSASTATATGSATWLTSINPGRKLGFGLQAPHDSKPATIDTSHNKGEKVLQMFQPPAESDAAVNQTGAHESAAPTETSEKTSEGALVSEEKVKLRGRAKLFRLSKDSGEWVESGIGPFRISKTRTQSKSGSQTSIILHQETHRGGPGIRLLLNVPLWSDMTIEIVEDSPKIVRLSGVDASGVTKGHDGKAELFLIKLSREEEANAFVRTVKKELKK